jgi:ADP-glucose pyrophosphorylase
MTLPRVLVLVLAGGAGGRLELLTEHRAKAAVPFAGVYRLVDFPLSNCQHAQLPDVWVSAQFHPVSLAEHLSNGRPWDLDRTDGGLMMLQPHRGTEREGETRASGVMVTSRWSAGRPACLTATGCHPAGGGRNRSRTAKDLLVPRDG